MSVAPAKQAPNREQQRPFLARGAARKLWGCRDEEVLIEGPAGTGKTRAILEKVFFQAMKYPGMRALLVRKTRESLTESALVTLEEKVVPEGHPILYGPKRNLRQHYNFSNGSVIVIGGMDKSTKIMSTEYDVIACFEATELTEEDFESLTTRLRNGVMPYQQIIADCNPSGPSHWLNQRAIKGRMTRLLSRHEDNPILLEGGNWSPDLKTYLGGGRWTRQGEKYLMKLDRLSGVRRLRLREGKWAAAEGVVYEKFDPLIHIIDRFKIPKEWRRIRTIDFGYRNPFVCQWWAISPDGVMYRYREIYMSERTVHKHAETIRQYSGDKRYEATIADHDLEDRETLHEEGIWTIPAYKDIRRGIEAVEARLEPSMSSSGQMTPRIYLLRDSVIEVDKELDEKGLPRSTDDEFDNYVYPKNLEGKPIKDLPVDMNNHGMDAMRYAVAYADSLAGQSVPVQAAKAVVIRANQVAMYRSN